MARENDKSLFISILINYETVSVSRNQDEKVFGVDISDNEDYVNTEYTLAPVIAGADNPKSTKVIEDVESFFYVFYPYGLDTPVTATFTKLDDTVFTLNINNATILNEAFKRIEITNTSASNAAKIKTIYS